METATAISLRADFGGAVLARGPVALHTTDYTARLDLVGLPADREVFVRVLFEELSSGRTLSAPIAGRFRTASDAPRDVTANAPPSAGSQFFSQVDINGETHQMTVTLKDLVGSSLYIKELEPNRVGR